MNGFKVNNLVATISKTHISPKQPGFVPNEPKERIGDAVKETNELPLSSKNQKIVEALALADVDYGKKDSISCEIVMDTNVEEDELCLVPGWAKYPKQERQPRFSLEVLDALKQIFDQGNVEKARRTSADRAHVLIIEGVACADWYQQAILTESRMKAFFFGMKKSEHLKMIQDAGILLFFRSIFERSKVGMMVSDEEAKSIILNQSERNG
jgi:hypothetical protein